MRTFLKSPDNTMNDLEAFRRPAGMFLVLRRYRRSSNRRSILNTHLTIALTMYLANFYGEKNEKDHPYYRPAAKGWRNCEQSCTVRRANHNNAARQGHCSFIGSGPLRGNRGRHGQA